jgi:hypothetical protein
MYLVRTATERTRDRMLARQIVAADAETARHLIASESPEHVAAIVGAEEVQSMRRREGAGRMTTTAGWGRSTSPSEARGQLEL